MPVQREIKRMMVLMGSKEFTMRVMPEGVRLHVWRHTSTSFGPTPVVSCVSKKKQKECGLD